MLRTLRRSVPRGAGYGAGRGVAGAEPEAWPEDALATRCAGCTSTHLHANAPATAADHQVQRRCWQALHGALSTSSSVVVKRVAVNRERSSRPYTRTELAACCTARCCLLLLPAGLFDDLSDGLFDRLSDPASDLLFDLTPSLMDSLMASLPFLMHLSHPRASSLAVAPPRSRVKRERERVWLKGHDTREHASRGTPLDRLTAPRVGRPCPVCVMLRVG